MNDQDGGNPFSKLIFDGLVLQRKPVIHLVVAENWNAAGSFSFASNPQDGDAVWVTDCFQRLTPNRAITINGNGNKICRVGATQEPAMEFPWVGAIPIGTNATF